ncbi:MAG: LpxI family protein [Deltaproteobacteria bacterium]|nr:MAG: LpxI family protein [Deltaproteobacteria bacterium]
METIGLIAGNGRFPVLFARAARARGLRVVAVAHRGETEPDLEREADSVTWVRVGQVGRVIRALKAGGVSRAVMAGGVNKVRSMFSLRPDWRAMRLLGRAAGRGDDALLRAVSAELESEGIEIVPSTVFLQDIVVERGHLAGPPLSEREAADVRLGCRVLAALGPLDIGQCVVVERGVVLAIEAVEGTDRTIERGGSLGTGRAVVIKAAKTGQDMRFDVPAVGPRTIETMVRSGAGVLAVQAGATIMLEGERLIEMAARQGITVVGCDEHGNVGQS